MGNGNSETKVSFRWIADLSMLAFICFMVGVGWFQLQAVAEDQKEEEGKNLQVRNEVIVLSSEMSHIKEDVAEIKAEQKEQRAILERIDRKIGRIE